MDAPQPGNAAELRGLLESLSPVERAVFLLREVFDGIVNPDKLQHLGAVSSILRLRPDGRDHKP
jgi:hypothetical protein